MPRVGDGQPDVGAVHGRLALLKLLPPRDNSGRRRAELRVRELATAIVKEAKAAELVSTRADLSGPILVAIVAQDPRVVETVLTSQLVA